MDHRAGAAWPRPPRLDPPPAALAVETLAGVLFAAAAAVPRPRLGVVAEVERPGAVLLKEVPADVTGEVVSRSPGHPQRDEPEQIGDFLDEEHLAWSAAQAAAA